MLCRRDATPSDEIERNCSGQSADARLRQRQRTQRDVVKTLGDALVEELAAVKAASYSDPQNGDHLRCG